MYHNKELLATRLYEIFDDMYVLDSKNIPVHIDKLINPEQKYSVILQIIEGLPRTPHEIIIDFHKTFQVPQEQTINPNEFIYRELRLSLILEEAIELGFSLGFSRFEIYKILTNTYNKVKNEYNLGIIKPDIENVFDSLLDLLVVTYGSFDIFNMNDILYDGLLEVDYSNNSKLIPIENKKALLDSVKHLKSLNYDVESYQINNDFIVIKDRITNKILKPLTFRKPDFSKIISNFLNSLKF